jgi:Zn-dependent protease with chaperone function
MMTKTNVIKFVETIADTMGVSSVKICITEMHGIIAFVNGIFEQEVHLNPAILSSGLSDAEIQGVLAHEVAHLSLNHPRIRAIYLLGVVLVGGLFTFCGLPWYGVITMIAWLFAFWLWVVPFQEYAADLFAASVLNNATGLISYLSKSNIKGFEGRVHNLKLYSKACS